MAHITLEAAMQIALAHHRAGRLDEAEALYEEVLARDSGHASALHLLGALNGQKGRFETAIELIGRAIARDSSVAAYHNDQGEAYRAAGRLEEAIGCFRRAIALGPGETKAHRKLGDALKARGDLDGAIDAYQRAIEIAPGGAAAHRGLADALHKGRRREAAIVHYQQALRIEPDDAATRASLGVAFFETGQFAPAIASFSGAVRLAPDDAMNHYYLGTALRIAGQPDEAITALGHAVRLNPDHAQAYTNLGLALHDAGRREDAVAANERALQIRPDNAVVLNNLGHVLYELGRFGEAVAPLTRAVQLRPDSAEAQSNLGNALQADGHLDAAIAAYDRVIQLRPDHAEAYANLSHVFQEQGRLDEALTCLRKALRLNPRLFRTASNLIYLLHFHPDHDAQAILAEHRGWAQQYADPLAADLHPHDNDRSPDRPLKVGFISPDFRGHPVGQLLQPLFAHHDRTQAQFFAYSDVIAPDLLTRRLASLADVWRETERLSDVDLSDRIRADRIDILVDLALHTARNRMLVFARKPAPVQVTMLGLPATTGLTTIDYRLTDPYLDPPGDTDADYSERSIRLPHCFWCYEPREGTPPVGALPALEKGHVTFGCLNHFAKVSRSALLLWIEILQRVPDSRLVLYSRHGSHLDAARALFRDGDIALDRVEFDVRVPPLQYLRRYHDLDLALDPFPYAGGTTTMDALWMGVPVVTLAGRTAVGRAGVSLLSNAGLNEFIAYTPEEYVAIAVSVANDRNRLAALRAGLRPRMRASPLADGQQYAADVEAAFRMMWRTWCGK